MKRIFVAALVAVMLAGALTLTGCGGGQDAALVGTWGWDVDASFEYVFNADGTGTRGVTGIFVEEFNWSTSGNELRVNLTGHVPAGYVRNERWTYTIAGNTLTIDSRQEAGMRYSYIRQ